MKSLFHEVAFCFSQHKRQCNERDEEAEAERVLSGDGRTRLQQIIHPLCWQIGVFPHAKKS